MIVIVSLLNNEEEEGHGPVDDDFIAWCDNFCLSINVSKSKDMIFDFLESQHNVPQRQVRAEQGKVRGQRQVKVRGQRQVKVRGQRQVKGRGQRAARERAEAGEGERGEAGEGERGGARSCEVRGR